MNKYEIRTNQKKEAILNAALKLFREKGFVNTSIKEIASLASVSQVSIYNYFESKNNMVKLAISHIKDELVLKAEEILISDIPFPEKVRKALSLCNDKACYSIEEFFSANALKDSQLIQAIIDISNEKIGCIYEKFINTGKAEGYIDKDVPTNIILDYIGSFYNLVNKPEYRDKDKKYENDLLKLFLNGLFIRHE